jgi:DNA-binding YbaB/EbfC family protein
MQQHMGLMQQKLENTVMEGSAGNGLVTVTLNGAKELKKIVIKPDCVNPNDVEGLQDLIVAAFADAVEKVDRQAPSFS